MSFMSFDYAMRAADAALQFQQSQGQNIKDTNSRTREVGTGNAKRKDDLVRQTIEAEYSAKSADIKKDKAEKLAHLALERKQSAMLTTMLVGGAALVGGMLDGIMDLAKGDPNKVPDSEQMNVDGQDAFKNGYATSFKIAGGLQNSESGAMVAFDQKNGDFAMVKMNTTTGKPDGFIKVSATDMASNLLNSVKDDTSPQAARIRGMIDQGPPPMFKAEHFQQKDGKYELSDTLKTSLFGGPNGNPAGYLASGSRVGSPVDEGAAASSISDIVKRSKDSADPGAAEAAKQIDGMMNAGPPPSFKPEHCRKMDDGTYQMSPEFLAQMQTPRFRDIGNSLMNAGKPIGNEAGERMVAGMLSNPAQISKAYGPTADSVMSMLRCDGIREGMQMSKENVDKTEKHLSNSGALKSGWDSAGNVAQKLLFKPLGTALPQFMELAKVAKQYDEEYHEKMVEYETAKKQAAAAREKLLKLQTLLAMGSNG